MSRELVSALANHAQNGLHLTPDTWVVAGVAWAEGLEKLAIRIHDRQPKASDLERFAKAAYELDIILRKERGDELAFDDLLRAWSDLTMTYDFIRRGIISVTQMAIAVYLQTINDPDDREFPRIVAPDLKDLRIGSLDAISVDTMTRILAAEPYVSWMERLRAQKARTLRMLRHFDLTHLEHMFEAGATRVEKYHAARGTRFRRQNHLATKAAHKSIRRAVKLFDRVFGIDDLKLFLGKQNLVIEGKLFDYHLRMDSCSLLEYTKSVNRRCAPCWTTVYNKKGVCVGDTCIYFPGTPIIDHVMAMKLSVGNEQTELDVLQAMNMTNTPTAFYSDPILPELKGIHDPRDAPTIFVYNVDYYAGCLNEPRHAVVHAASKTLMQKAAWAFTDIMHLGKRYLPTMQRCSQFGIDTFAQRTPAAMRALEAVIQADQDGLY